MRWWLVVLALVVAACGVPVDETATLVDDSEVPFGLLEEDAPQLAPPPGGETPEPLVLCFVRDAEVVRARASLFLDDELLPVVQALATPPQDDPPTLQTALSDPDLVTSVELQGGIAHVDLDDAFAAIDGEQQLLALAQLVCTLTARPGIGQVSFSLEGSPIDAPGADGSLRTGPVSRDDYEPLIR